MSSTLLFNISSNVILTTADTDAHYLLKPHGSLLHFTLFTHPVCECFQKIQDDWARFQFNFFQPEQFGTSCLISRGSLSEYMIREKREFMPRENFRHEFNAKDSSRARAYVTVLLFSLKYMQWFSHAIHACLTQVCLEIDDTQSSHLMTYKRMCSHNNRLDYRWQH